jgi:putative ubiquitin-RnfH superfamily antitoxin RatB of RatAB toxin-antitoxin module
VTSEDGSTTNAKPEEIAFTNEVKCANITITKIVDGTEYTKDEAFDFWIMIPVGGDTITLKDGETIQGAIYNSDKSKVSDVSVAVNGAGIGADVKANGTKFQLKNGQYLELYAPVSMIYKVIEEDYTKESYETDVEYAAYGSFQPDEDKEGRVTDGKTTITCGTGDDAKEYVGVKGTTNTDVNRVTFTNSRHINVATGINLDFVPYVVVLALVLAAGGAVLVYKKKRTVR